MSKLKELDWKPSLSKFFWTCVSISIFGLVFLWIETSNKWSVFSIYSKFLLICLLFFILLFLNFIFSIWHQLRLQKIRNQASWIYYIGTGIAIGPVAITLFLILFFQLSYKLSLANFLVFTLNRIIFNAAF